MQIKSIFSLLLRSTLVTLVLRVIRYHTDYEVEACHSTTIYVQNGTWLNTSRWLQNGFFGSEDLLPLTEPTPSLPFTDKSTTVNPVNPLLGFIPNKRQKCLCGTITSESNQHQQEWLASITVSLGGDTGTPVGKCLGVLLNRRYVLTAAHCFCGGILLDCDSSTQFPAHPWIIHLDDNKRKERSRSPTVKVDFLGRDLEDGSEGNMQSITVRRVIVYEKYVQANNLISDGDVALLELQGFPHRMTSEGRRVALQPICLPPLANTAGRQGGFHDVDCFGANELNPYPFFDIENKTIHQVCKPTQEGKTSFISTRKNKEGCFTIGYGPVPAGTPCLSSCWTEDDYPNKNVVRFSDYIGDLGSDLLPIPLESSGY